MDRISDEDVVMRLIVPSGQARSAALTAITEAREGRFEDARSKLGEAHGFLNQAHELQSEIIRQELNDGSRSEVSLIMAHGQDHLMSATTICDLAGQMIEILASITTP